MNARFFYVWNFYVKNFIECFWWFPFCTIFRHCIWLLASLKLVLCVFITLHNRIFFPRVSMHVLIYINAYMWMHMINDANSVTIHTYTLWNYDIHITYTAIWYEVMRKGEAGGEGWVWRNLRGGGRKFWLLGNGATQSATCCTMCKRSWVGIGHERFENSGSVLSRHPGLFSLDYKGYTGGRCNPTP